MFDESYTLKMEAAGSSGVLVPIYYTTWPHISGDSTCTVNEMTQYCFGKLFVKRQRQNMTVGKVLSVFE
jgi:hypothetical protein